MKILHNLDNSNIGGIQELIFNLYKHSRHQHDFWAADGTMAPIMRMMGMTLWNGNPPEDARYDVIVGHGVGGWSCDNLAAYAHSHGAKFVEVMHSVARALTQPSSADGFIAVSDLALDRNRHMPRAQRIYPMLNCLFQDWTPGTKIGRLSRLHPDKHPYELGELARHFPHQQFLIGGDGPERERLTGIPNVELAGLVRDFQAFYAQLKLYVYHAGDECCCMTVAMAQAAGVPLIVQDLPALRETTGSYATFCQSPGDFMMAVWRFLEDPSATYLQASEGRAWAYRNFNPLDVAQQWDVYLESIAKGE